MIALYTFLILVPTLSLAAVLVLMAMYWRKRWYLIQNLSWDESEWVPTRLWGMKDCKPLCLMIFRVWGPFPSEDAALAAWEKEYGQAGNQHAENS